VGNNAQAPSLPPRDSLSRRNIGLSASMVN
jgi:hypothetical protein